MTAEQEREAVVAYLRLGQHIHSRCGALEFEQAFKIAADAIERGDHHLSCNTDNPQNEG